MMYRRQWHTGGSCPGLCAPGTTTLNPSSCRPEAPGHPVCYCRCSRGQSKEVQLAPMTIRRSLARRPLPVQQCNTHETPLLLNTTILIIIIIVIIANIIIVIAVITSAVSSP